MSRIDRHGRRHLYSLLGRRSFVLHYSTSAAPQPQPHFMVDYLITSLGFSTQEAISVSAKVTRLKSIQKPALVLNLFQQCGLDKTQIKNIVSSVPKLLLHNVDKTLKPKFKLLQDLGLSGSDLVKLISGNQTLFRRGLNTHFIPTIDYLRQVLGTDQKVVKAINRSKWLLSCNIIKRMPPNVLLLQNTGFSNNKIDKFICQNPRFLIQKSGWLQDIIHRVEGELGISRHAAMFFHGIEALGGLSKSTIEMKFRVFKSFGWLDSDITTMARNLPFCLCLSEAKLRKGLSFFMMELGYEPQYLASRPKFLAYSLEKRVVPRYNVLKILKEKKLLKTNLTLYSAVCYTESKFVEDFVVRYKDEIPDLHENYTNSTRC